MYDYYKILNLPINASKDEIKASYRLLAHKFHPDKKHTIDDNIIKIINEAYDTLSNDEKRKKYDLKNNTINHSKLTKTFNMDINQELVITLEESLLGASKLITHEFKSSCTSCSGYGGTYSICNKCNNSGVIQSSSGFLSINTTCNQCSGIGLVKISGCSICKGTGYHYESEDVEVNIPEGILTKTKILIKGKGNHDSNKRGNLILHITINDSIYYTRKENNIYYTHSVDAIDILMGNEILINTIKGDISLIIDYENTPIIMKGMGTKMINSDIYGDMVINIKPIFKSLTKIQKDILSKL